MLGQGMGTGVWAKAISSPSSGPQGARPVRSASRLSDHDTPRSMDLRVTQLWEDTVVPSRWSGAVTVTQPCMDIPVW